jgi:hypothetical protein
MTGYDDDENDFDSKNTRTAYTDRLDKMVTKMLHVRAFSGSGVFRQKSFYDENFGFRIF